ncbi:MAG: TIGR02147 family protein [Bdellovibrionaceae bacterium]|nr:TIGR02147 family protein [Pseudobdellovibrionaceae bacterium]
MNSSIFQFRSYRVYLKERLEALGPKSGLKRKAAEALEVHTTFISQVVLEKADLSLDQGEKMNVFLKHSEDESEYFLDLIIFERAADPNLRKRYEAKLDQWRTKTSEIKSRIKPTFEISDRDQEKFYSSHLYGLIHVLTSIPEYQSKKALVSGTGFSQSKVEDAIEFMVRIGVLKVQKDKIVPGENHVHLGRDSKLIRQHHTNWRMATIQNLGFSKPEDLHYSLTFSCSEKDAAKLRDSILEHLKSMTQVIQKSKEETPYVYCFDFWKP